MWCPQCLSEYRAGFERCGSCEVDLVETQPGEPLPQKAEAPPPRRAARVEFCGFFSLEEAVESRLKLREAGLVGEILIREAPRLEGEPDPGDEFWLLVDPAHVGGVRKVLDMEGIDTEGEAEAPASTRCPECGAKRDPRDRLCLRCGVAFDASAAPGASGGREGHGE